MNFEAIKDTVCRAAEAAGLKEYEISASVSESISAETLRDEISAFSSSVGGNVSFRCIVDGRAGEASTEDCGEAALEELVLSAISNAECIDSTDEPIIFAGSEKYADADNGACELTDAKKVQADALRLQRAMYATDARVTDGTESSVFSSARTVYLYNSYGLSLSNRVGACGAYACAVIRDGEESQDHYESLGGSDIDSLEQISPKAVQGALDKLGATTVPSGSYDVLFSGKQFGAFLSAFSSIFSAKQALLGLSLLAGKGGEQIASEIVTIVDDPMREGSGMKRSFDGEGVATYRKNVVENGVLKTLLHSLVTAKKAGVQSTGNGLRGGNVRPYNLSICAGKDSEEALMAAIGDGIYITECKGFHAGANAVTGDFSIESAGFRIRDGKRAEPIKSFTVAGNFFDLLRRIDRLGDRVEWGIPSTRAFASPAVLVRSMNVAGE